MVKEIQNERKDGGAKIRGKQIWRGTDETNADNTNADNTNADNTNADNTNADNTNAGMVNKDARKAGSLQ
jgi:hypothetical protein